jgi:hypothetical protein
MMKSQKEKPPFVTVAYLLSLFSLVLLSSCAEMYIPMPEERAARNSSLTPQSTKTITAKPAVPAIAPMKCLVVYSPLSMDRAKALESEIARDTVIDTLKENDIPTHNKILGKMIERETKTDELSVADQELIVRARQRGVNCLTIFHLEWGPEDRDNAQVVFRAKAYNVNSGKLLGITENFGEAPALIGTQMIDSPWMLAAVRAAQKGTNALTEKINPPKQDPAYLLFFTGFNDTEMNGIHETIVELNNAKVVALRRNAQALQITISVANSDLNQLDIQIKNRFRQLNFPLRTRQAKGNSLHFIRE